MFSKNLITISRKRERELNGSRKKGFTLIELLVVIAIIGLLSSIVLVSMQGTRAKARDARRLQEIKQIQTALVLYYDRYEAYPVGGAGSDRGCWINNGGYSACHPLGALKDAGIMSKVPVDPGANTYIGGTGCGAAQFYAYWSDGQKYLLASVIERNGTAGCTECGGWWGYDCGTYSYQNVIKSW